MAHAGVNRPMSAFACEYKRWEYQTLQKHATSGKRAGLKDRGKDVSIAAVSIVGNQKQSPVHAAWQVREGASPSSLNASPPGAISVESSATAGARRVESRSRLRLLSQKVAPACEGMSIEHTSW